MAARNEDTNLSPRVSALEAGQEAVQKDISQLALTVRELGTNLSNSIINLSQTQATNYNSLSEKIGSSNKTDWQSLFTGFGILIILGGASLTPVWLAFNYIDKQQVSQESKIDRLQFLAEESIRERSANTVRITSLERATYER